MPFPAAAEFHDIPDELRGVLLDRVTADPRLPACLCDPDANYTARGFYILMTRPRNGSVPWADLPAILSTLSINGMEEAEVSLVHGIIGDAMGHLLPMK